MEGGAELEILGKLCQANLSPKNSGGWKEYLQNLLKKHRIACIGHRNVVAHGYKEAVKEINECIPIELITQVR